MNIEEITSMVVANGLWAVLFCGLLVYELRDSRKRESRYTLTIGKLTDRLGTLAEVKSDTGDIKTDIKRISTDVAEVKAVCTVKKRKKSDANSADTASDLSVKAGAV